MADLDSSFEQMLGRKATREEIDSLHRVKRTLGLADNDALWVVLIALEYYDALYRQYPSQIASQMAKTLQRQQAAVAAMVDTESRRAVTDLVRNMKSSMPAGSIHPDLARARWALASAWTVFALIVFAAWCVSVGYLLGSGKAPPWARAVDGPGMVMLLSMLARTPAGWAAPVVAACWGVGAWTAAASNSAAPMSRRQRGWLALGWTMLAVLMLLVALPLAGP